MKKKLMICVGIFAIIFLLWPTSLQTFPCGPTGDCPPQQSYSIGGGAKVIGALISHGYTQKGISQFWFKDNSYFEPSTAFLGALAIATFVYSTHHVVKKKRRKTT